MKKIIIGMFTLLLSTSMLIAVDFSSLPKELKREIFVAVDQGDDLNTAVKNVYRLRQVNKDFKRIIDDAYFSQYLIENVLSQKVPNIPEIQNEQDKNIVAALLLMGTPAANVLGVIKYLEKHGRDLQHFTNQFDYYTHYYSNSIPKSYEYRQRYLPTYRKIAQALVDLGFTKDKLKVFDEIYRYAFEINKGAENPDDYFKSDLPLFKILAKAGMDIYIPEE